MYAHSSVVKRMMKKDKLKILTRNDIMIISVNVSGYFDQPYRQKSITSHLNLVQFLLNNKTKGSKFETLGMPCLTEYKLYDQIIDVLRSRWVKTKCKGLIIVISAYGTRKFARLTDCKKFAYDHIDYLMRKFAKGLDFVVVKDVSMPTCCLAGCKMNDKKLSILWKRNMLLRNGKISWRTSKSPKNNGNNKFQQKKQEKKRKGGGNKRKRGRRVNKAGGKKRVKGKLRDNKLQNEMKHQQNNVLSAAMKHQQNHTTFPQLLHCSGCRQMVYCCFNHAKQAWKSGHNKYCTGNKHRRNKHKKRVRNGVEQKK